MGAVRRRVVVVTPLTPRVQPKTLYEGHMRGWWAKRETERERERKRAREREREREEESKC